MRPHKLCLVRANKTKFGGAEVYLSRLSQVLSEKNIEHKVINSPFPNFLPSWLRVILFNVYLCLTKSSKFYFSLDRITCPDVYRAGDGVHKRFLEIENKSRINLLHPIYLFIEKRSFKKAKLIIAISEMVKNDIINCYGISPKKIQVIPNGIKLKKFNYLHSFNKISKEFHLERDEKVLLFVGSGYKRKGVVEFLNIVSMLKSSKIRAFIIGKESNINHYENISKQLNIQEKVVFTGPREDVGDFYAVGDIFLFPTHYEPFGSVILEAMSYGNAVYTTKYCGGGELLQSNFIMKSPDDYSIVKSIEDLLNNKAKLDMIKFNNTKISCNYSIEQNVQATLDEVERCRDSESI